MKKTSLQQHGTEIHTIFAQLHYMAGPHMYSTVTSILLCTVSSTIKAVNRCRYYFIIVSTYN